MSVILLCAFLLERTGQVRNALRRHLEFIPLRRLRDDRQQHGQHPNRSRNRSRCGMSVALQKMTDQREMKIGFK